MPGELNHSTFAEKLGATFRLLPDDGKTLDIKLTEVSDLQTSPHSEQFAIVFRGPAETSLTQGTHRLEHEDMGEFALFLVPVGSDAEGLLYEAVFNRLLPDETP